MPAIKEYPYSDLGAIERADKSERAKRTDYVGAAWKYYRGEHRKSLKVRPGQPDDNIIINLCKKLIDTGVAMLFGEIPQYEIVEGQTTPVESYIERVWQANHGKAFLTDIALSGSVAGHVGVKIVPREGQPPRLVNLDMARLEAFWREGDIEDVLFYVFRTGDKARQDIVKQDNGGWLVRDLEYKQGGWHVIPETEVRWGYEWPPIIDWKNLPNPHQYYGLSDLEMADLNDAVNFIASNTNRIIKIHAHPKTIGIGMDAKDVQETSIDSFWTIQNPDAKITNLEMQSDLRSSLEFFQLLRNAFFSLSASVDLASMKDRIGQITNFGLRVLFKDALDRLELKRSLYGAALIEINRRVAELGGHGPDNVGVLHWANPLPEDRLEDVEAAVKERELGTVSKETLAADLGRKWELEQERIANEAQGEDDIGTRLLRAFERGA